MATRKLYELLAQEGQLKGQSAATRTELIGTLKSKRHLFEETRIVFQPNTDGASQIEEKHSKLQSTVMQELKWLAGIWSKAINLSYAVQEGNTQARGDVVLDDGTVLIKNAPAAALLELDKRAGELQDLLNAVPTLDPAKAFELDPSRPAGEYKAREIRKERTKKIFSYIVMVPPTPEHPAQVKELMDDKVIGTVAEAEWSGLITPAQKADLLTRVEDVRRATKAALFRANAVEVTAAPNVAGALFNYVLDGQKPTAATP